MAEADPFALYAQDDRTVVIRPQQDDRTVVIRPQPGGRASPPSPAPPPKAPFLGAGEQFPAPSPLSDRFGKNPLLAAALPILNLAPLLRNPVPPADPASLRTRLLGQLERYREAARVAGADDAAAERATWALAALLDDIVLNTPWGAASGWGGRSLVASIWSETDAGERFFERLARMQQEPGRHRQVLELFHRCLAMGFEGRYRVARTGAREAEEVRRGVARLLGDLAGPADSSLSPHWTGAALPARAPATLVPPWVTGVAAVALLLVLFTAFRFSLVHSTAELGPLVAGLPPSGPVTIVRDPPREVPPRPAPERPRRLPIPEPTAIPAFLAEEQRQGLVTVQEEAQRVLIRLVSADLFAPGSAEIASSSRPLLDRIGQALRTRPGHVMVTGYTDSDPVRRSLRFANNQELSEARAASVKALLAETVGDAARLTSVGKGERDPIGDNRTEEGRARNRRVEVMLLKVAEDPR
jgi:type VI secretion system protein ImpK